MLRGVRWAASRASEGSVPAPPRGSRLVHPAAGHVKGRSRRDPGPAVPIALLALILSACGTAPRMDAGPEPCSEDGRVQVGAGGARLTSLPETGGQLPIVHGAQGGIHVLVGVWVRDLPLEMDLTYRLVDPSDDAPVGQTTALHLTPGLFSVDGARYQRNPDLVVLDNAHSDVTGFAGRTVRLEVEADTSAGRSCDVRSVTLVDSP